MSLCENCEFTFYKDIAKFFRKDEESVQFLCGHGVLPNRVLSPRCKSECSYRSDKHSWRCPKLGYPQIKKKKERKKSVWLILFDYNSSFLQNTHIDRWKIVLFVNEYLGRSSSQTCIMELFGLSPNSLLDWRSLAQYLLISAREKQNKYCCDNSVIEASILYILRPDRQPRIDSSTNLERYKIALELYEVSEIPFRV